MSVISSVGLGLARHLKIESSGPEMKCRVLVAVVLRTIVAQDKTRRKEKEVKLCRARW